MIYLYVLNEILIILWFFDFLLLKSDVHGSYLSSFGQNTVFHTNNQLIAIFASQLSLNLSQESFITLNMVLYMIFFLINKTRRSTFAGIFLKFVLWLFNNLESRSTIILNNACFINDRKRTRLSAYRFIIHWNDIDNLWRFLSNSGNFCFSADSMTPHQCSIFSYFNRCCISFGFINCLFCNLFIVFSFNICKGRSTNHLNSLLTKFLKLCMTVFAAIFTAFVSCKSTFPASLLCKLLYGYIRSLSWIIRSFPTEAFPSLNYIFRF